VVHVSEHDRRLRELDWLQGHADDDCPPVATETRHRLVERTSANIIAPHQREGPFGIWVDA
jgi:hypothetical protein